MTLAMSELDVARLTRPQREDRVRNLVWDARRIVDEAVREHFEKHELTATVVLYSGGNDSTTLAHLFTKMYPGRATHAAHINTGIGIEKTRQFVRDVCADWGLPLLEYGPDEKDSYRTLVLDQGFPGPAHHFKMYQRLKERGLLKVRRHFVSNPRKQRILFLAGRRRSESERRKQIPEHERVGSIVWASPLVHWTKLDLQAYRLMVGDVPRNEVSDLIHMSGECLCGSFATKGELDEIGMWFPDVKAEIEDLEREVAATGKHPEQKCKWGWGAYRQDIKRSESGPLCTTCDEKASGGEIIIVPQGSAEEVFTVTQAI